MLNRRQCLGTLTTAATAMAAQATRRPNIVVMMADDMGFSDIGCYGSEIRTPHLDSLAKAGLRFTQFYNGARCCPTRAALMTGLYAHQAGVGHMVDTAKSLPGYTGDLSTNCVTIAQVLRASGYRTMMTGKWHVTPVSNDQKNWPLQRGFERYYGTITGAGSFYDPGTLTSGNEAVTPGSPDFYYTDAIAKNTEKFLDELGQGPDPFFAYVAFTAPHWPMHAPESEIAKYKGRYAKGWDALRTERHKRMIDLGVVDKSWPLTDRDDSVPKWENEQHKEWMQRRMEVYAAMVDRLDQAVGRILAKLKALNQLENTLILFLADNGGCAEELKVGPGNPRSVPKMTRDGRPVRHGNDPSIMPGKDDDYQSYGLPWANVSNTPFRRYKHWVHEGGISSPLIAHWPKGITKGQGSWVHEPAHLIDVMATCVDLGQAKYPATHNAQAITPMEGRTLAPLLAGAKTMPQRALYWEHEGNRAMREGDWKIVSQHPRGWELYNIRRDRSERQNLAAAQPERLQTMTAKWEAWASRAQVVPWEQFLAAK